MNERIKELLEQADIKFDKDINEIDVCVMLPVDLEKFAELIIADCVRICKNNSQHEDLSHNPETIGHIRAGASVCLIDIKEHFGVK